MGSPSGYLLLIDRTAALFVGLGVGAVVASSFGTATSGGAAAGTEAGPLPAAASAVIPAAHAAPAPRPAAEPVPPRLAQAIAEGRPIEIGVFGDSFGEGVWAGIYNQLRGDPGFEVRQFSERATGFTRYRSFNILDDVRTKLDRQPVDIAVLSFGANDTQGIYLDGRGHTYMSEGWQRIVTERVTALVELLRERGIAVYWVGLPKMREAAYDSDIQAMNRFYAGRMDALSVPYVDTVPLTVDAQGAYAPYLPAEPGRRERRMARVNDGIHMTIPGYIHVTRGLTGQIRGVVDRARAEARAEGGRGAARAQG